jgi:hypothetical protein
LLRPVERFVGLAQNERWVRPGGPSCNPSTDRHIQPAVVGPRCHRYCQADPLDQGVCLVDGEVGKKQRQFLPAVSVASAAPSCGRAQNFANPYQHVVARLVTVGVVHLLEVVDVEHGYYRDMVHPFGSKDPQDVAIERATTKKADQLCDLVVGVLVPERL